MPTVSADRGVPQPRHNPASAPQPNYFDSAAVAARYARVRPYYHAELAARVRSFARVQRFGKVLDVGCGTGHSSIAWAEIADEVTAIDPSPHMLAVAHRRTNVHYREGAAEHLDFAVGEFDLISAGSALHWFDQESFYGGCADVLAADGLLAIYNDHFTAHMKDSPACKRWMRTSFARRYPPPRRGMRDFDESCAAACGFSVVCRGSFTHLVRYTRRQFVAYLLTRSNTLAALARGRESESAMLNWLDGELAGILGDSAAGEFVFKCNHWLLRRA
jgi:SAM-dependent methyltransferase